MDHNEFSAEPIPASVEDAKAEAVDESLASDGKPGSKLEQETEVVGDTGSEVPMTEVSGQPDEDATDSETEIAEVSGQVDERVTDSETEEVVAAEGETAEEIDASTRGEEGAGAAADDQDELDLAAVFEEQPLERILEAMIGSNRTSLSIDRMISALGDHAPEKSEVREALSRLSDDCESRSVQLKETASGFRFQVRQDFAPWVARLTEEKPQRYSRAALETLALIAYRQPITRGEIEQVRGVAVSTNIIRTLEERNWVRVVGHKDVPGRPALFATTREFLDYFGMKTLTELPSLEAVKDLDALGEKLAELGQAAPVTERSPEAGAVMIQDGEPVEPSAPEDLDSDFDIRAMFASEQADPEPHEMSVASAVEAAMAMDIGMSLDDETDEFEDEELDADSAFLIGEVFSPTDTIDDESPAEPVAEKPQEPVEG